MITMDDADLERRLRALRLVPPAATLDVCLARAWWRRRAVPPAVAASIAVLGGVMAWGLATTSRVAPQPPAEAIVHARTIQHEVEVRPFSDAVRSEVHTTMVRDPQLGLTTTITQQVVGVRFDPATVH
jgi:hypothetical protein